MAAFVGVHTAGRMVAAQVMCWAHTIVMHLRVVALAASIPPGVLPAYALKSVLWTADQLLCLQLGSAGEGHPL
jgi:hypothetical protein